MNYYDIMRQRAQDERNRRMQQSSVDVSAGVPLPKLPPMLASRQIMQQQQQQQGGGQRQPPSAPQQFGPPMPPAWQVAGYTRGMGDAGPGAQSYANQFSGGDLSKVRARQINIDGEMKNDYYTKGLLDDFMPGPKVPQPGAAPDASSGGYGPPQADWLDRLRMMFNFGGA